jgi:hypothetical protein
VTIGLSSNNRVKDALSRLKRVETDACFVALGSNGATHAGSIPVGPTSSMKFSPFIELPVGAMMEKLFFIKRLVHTYKQLDKR